MPHKVVADCVEALIGAHYVAGGELGASRFMRALGLVPPMPPTAHDLPEEDRTADSPLSRFTPLFDGYSCHKTVKPPAGLETTPLHET